MKIELYLISPHEEYANKHMCRKHWSYQWRGRRGLDMTPNKNVKVRQELFGGLLQAPDGKLYKLDDEAYFYMDLFFGK